MTVSEKLNQLQADAHVFFVKLHNYHWNIKGMQFYNLHLKTEEFYNYFATMFDDLAERNLQLGGTPLVTMRQILEKSKIQEDERNTFDAEYIVKNILSDFKHFHSEFKNLSEISGGDATTTAYADDQTAWLEKEIWMLRSMLGEK